jgi:hypothetical protein
LSKPVASAAAAGEILLDRIGEAAMTASGERSFARISSDYPGVGVARWRSAGNAARLDDIGEAERPIDGREA